MHYAIWIIQLPLSEKQREERICHHRDLNPVLPPLRSPALTTRPCGGWHRWGANVGACGWHRRVAMWFKWGQTEERTWKIFHFLPFNRGNDKLKISALFTLNQAEILKFSVSVGSKTTEIWKKTVVGKIQTMTLVFGPHSENDWNIQYTWFPSSEISVYWKFIGVPKPIIMCHRERLRDFLQPWILCIEYCHR